MRTYLYKFLGLFGWQPKLSAETGFVIPENNELFKRALKKYLLWMLLTGIATGAAEFLCYIVAIFYFNYGGHGGNAWLNVQTNSIIFWFIILLPIGISAMVHAWMYRSIKRDDPRLGWLHCLIFIGISLLAAAPTIYFCFAFFYL